MKLFLNAALLAAGMYGTELWAQQINFSIEGVNSSQGKIYIQLFQGEEAYKSQQPFQAKVVKAQAGTQHITFPNTPTGDYGVRFFHDENDDGELATNMVGMPTEGYGYSNAAKPSFGPVRYDQIKFEVSEQNSTTTNNSRVIY